MRVVPYASPLAEDGNAPAARRHTGAAPRLPDARRILAARRRQDRGDGKEVEPLAHCLPPWGFLALELVFPLPQSAN